MPFPVFHSGGIIEHVTLSAWLLSLNNKYLAWHHCPCFLPSDLEWVSVCYLPMEGQLGCFEVLAILGMVVQALILLPGRWQRDHSVFKVILST